MDKMTYTIGIDVGGTNVVAGLFDGDGVLLAKLKTPTEKSSGTEGFLDQLAGLARKLLSERGIAEGSLAAVGIGLPGFMNEKDGTVTAANLPLSGTPVAQLLSRKLGVPVAVQNDVRMIVYGETIRGAGAGYRHVLGLTLGTGMSAAFVTDGRIHTGAEGLAGEIGHVIMDGVQYTCGCGMTGCLETIASATGIARQAQDGLAAGRGGLLAERFPYPSSRGELTARDVWQAAVDGDDFALSIYRYTAEKLALALAPAVILLSPDVVIVGGGVAAAGDILFGPLREEVSRRVHPLYRERLRIVPGSLDDDAGLIGSAAYAQSLQSR
ncbi:MAG: ROK family protein [Cohnella sp.]|nr:MAG: ROK family protein [Cohnella sp.]